MGNTQANYGLCLLIAGSLGALIDLPNSLSIYLSKVCTCLGPKLWGSQKTMAEAFQPKSLQQEVFEEALLGDMAVSINLGALFVGPIIKKETCYLGSVL